LPIPAPQSFRGGDDPACRDAIVALQEIVQRQISDDFAVALSALDFYHLYRGTRHLTLAVPTADGRTVSCATFGYFASTMLHKSLRATRQAMASALGWVACVAVAEEEPALRKLVREAPGLRL
jgi:hypothetical protein